MLGPARDDNLASAVFNPIVPPHLGDDGILELVRTAHRGVLRKSIFNGLDGCPLDVLGRIEVWLSGPEADDVPAFGAKGVGLGGDRQGRGGLDG